MLHHFTGYGTTEGEAIAGGTAEFTAWFGQQNIRYTMDGAPLFGVSGSLCCMPAVGSDEAEFVYLITVFDPRRSFDL